MTRMGPTKAPHSLWSLQMRSLESWEKPEKGEHSYQNQFSGFLSLVTSQERKVKFPIVPSFPNSYSCEFVLRVLIIYQFFPTPKQSLPPSLSSFVSCEFGLTCHLSGYVDPQLLYVQAAQP